MRIVRGGMSAFTLPLVQLLETAHGPIASRQGFLVTLEDETGSHGFGEATPLPDFGTESLSLCREAIVTALEVLVEASSLPLAERWQAALLACRDAPCARAAIDGALHDLAARTAGASLADWVRGSAGLPGPARRSVLVQALIGGSVPDAVAEAARTARASGFRAFKLKLAVSTARPDLARDLERVAALREAVGPEALIRLDANEAWSEAEARRALDALAPYSIDYVEQPVSRGDLEALARLDREAPVAVAADEALLGEGLEACLAGPSARILIAKPAALGGIGASLDLYARATERGLRIVWSSLIDGAVGRATALAIAAALSEEDEVAGLGTAELLASDLAPGLERSGGEIRLADVPGIGVEPPPAWAAEGACWGESWCVPS